MLPLKSLNPKEALEIVKYHTWRNHVAYLSHAKKSQHNARLLGLKFPSVKLAFYLKD